MMKKKRHFLFMVLGIMTALPLAAMYWWSGELVYLFCCEGGSPSSRDAAVKIVIQIPFLRKANLVEVAASRHLKRGDMRQILQGRYTEDVLLNEVDALWCRRLAAKEYYRAGIALAFGQSMLKEKFRKRIRKEQIEELVKGLGANLDDYLIWYWSRTISSENAAREEAHVTFNREYRRATAMVDLKAYPLN